MSLLLDLHKDIKRAADPERARIVARFFKTGKGEYGEGDVFVGIAVPILRRIAAQYKTLSLPDVIKLLKSKIHEERLIALLILVHQFKKGDKETCAKIYKLYLANTKHINNWDLVDLSAGYIVGSYLIDKPRHILKKLAKSKNLWDRRIAIIATFAFIYQGEASWTLKIADILLQDKHDLIQKAVGWMLREIGKRVSREIEEEFLKTRYKTMPRTTLRYAIEHFPEEKRKKYLRGAL